MPTFLIVTCRHCGAERRAATAAQLPPACLRCAHEWPWTALPRSSFERTSFDRSLLRALRIRPLDPPP